MINEKFREVLKHEGVVTILSWGATPEPHLVNTWNSYLEITQDGKILVPAFGFRQTEKSSAIKTTKAPASLWKAPPAF